MFRRPGRVVAAAALALVTATTCLSQAPSAEATATEPTITSVNTTPDKFIFSSSASIPATVSAEVDEPDGWRLIAARFKVCIPPGRNAPCENWSERWLKLSSTKKLLQNRTVTFKGAVPNVDPYTGLLARWSVQSRVSLTYVSPGGDTRTYESSTYISPRGDTRVSLSGPDRITPGRSLTLTGKFECYGWEGYGPPLNGPYGPVVYVNVEFQREGSSTWSYVAGETVTSIPNGTFEYFNLAVGASGNWRARFSDYGMCEERYSNVLHVEAKDGGTPPPVAKVPSAPFAVVSRKTHNTATITWAPPAQRNGTIKGYRWGWTSSNGLPQKTWDWVYPSPPNPFVMTNLHPSTTYTMWVEAINENGTGARRTVTVKTNPAPKAPALKGYSSCTDLNKVYAHGVGKIGARDKVAKGKRPVTAFYVNSPLYYMNDGRDVKKKQYDLDYDNDGIACER